MRSAFFSGLLAAAIFVAPAVWAQPVPTAPLPDLTVQSVTIERGRVVARIANIGAATAPARSTASLYVYESGRQVAKADAVTSALVAGASEDAVFAFALVAGQTYQVMADSARVVAESNETNNRTRNETFAPAPVRGAPAPAQNARGVMIDPSLRNEARAHGALAAADGAPRPVGVARFDDGTITAFVENELVLTAATPAAADAFAAPLGPRVLSAASSLIITPAAPMSCNRNSN